MYIDTKIPPLFPQPGYGAIHVCRVRCPTCRERFSCARYRSRQRQNLISATAPSIIYPQPRSYIMHRTPDRSLNPYGGWVTPRLTSGGDWVSLYSRASHHVSKLYSKVRMPRSYFVVA
uniref:Uncharacterized protein n=1 Tax=Panagrolaimus sp. PS1159 TaxID=55785 RepID=A0AC35FTS3_9BILA